MKNKSLSQLVRDYSTGEINEREYREMRTKLIQDIVVGNIIIEKIKYIPPANQKNRKIIINKIIKNSKWNNQFYFIKHSKKVTPSWFGLAMLINIKFHQRSSRLLKNHQLIFV